MKKKVIAGIILGVMGLSLLLALAVRPDHRAPGRAASDRGQVGILYIDGPIMSGRGSSGPFGSQMGSEDIAATIREATRDPAIKAVVIRLNSPGGTAAAAQEISAEVERLKQSGKKVVASMGDTAASGAYWIAAGADKIVANPGTLTGSIGVIIQLHNLQGLFGKLGVEQETFKSGPHKDMGSPLRQLTREERAIFQSMIDDIYNQFVDVVAKGRHKDAAEIKPLADGRIFTGNQAKELGLVDELGDLHHALMLAGELAGIPDEPAVVDLGPKNIWRDLFRGAGGNTFLWQGWPSFFYKGEAYSLELR